MKLNEIADNAGAAQEAHARRPRHRLRQGQDRRPRRQGPEGALGRAHQGLRRRPDAAAPAPAEARLQQLFAHRAQRGQSRPHPGRRSTPASSTPRRRSTSRRWSKAGVIGARRTACGCSATARLKAKLDLRGSRRFEVRGRGGREGRRHGEDPGAGEAGRRPRRRNICVSAACNGRSGMPRQCDLSKAERRIDVRRLRMSRVRRQR